MSEAESTQTKVVDFISELNAGMLVEKLGVLLSQAALGTILNNNKKGKVGCEFTFTQIGENDQVIVTVKLTNSTPTKRGKTTEEDCTDTPFYVGRGGKLTIELPKQNFDGQFALDMQDDTKISSINQSK